MENNIFKIAKREFLVQVKKRSFIILTILAPLLIIAFGGLVGVMFKANESSTTITLVDKSGLFKDKLQSDARLKFVSADPNQLADEMKVLSSNKAMDGILVIPELKDNNYNLLEENMRLFVKKNMNFDAKKLITDRLEKILKSEKIKTLGLTDLQIKNLDKNLKLNTENIINKKTTDNEELFTVKYGIGFFLMYVVFMFIIIYGVRIMRSVLEEKNNRVVEVILSSVKPFELMMGKIIGVTLVALTQFTIWIIMSIGTLIFLSAKFGVVQSATKIQAKTNEMPLNIEKFAGHISKMLLSLDFPIIIITFICFFLFGYLLYSSMYAAIGSSVDSEIETQQFTLLAILPLSLGLYGSFSIMNNPDGPTAFWLSMIPFTSPVAMLARIPFGVPYWQLITSLLLLIGTTLFMVFLASKIYKVGILMHGNKTTLKELWKWLKQ